MSCFGVLSKNGDYERWIWKILSDGFVFFCDLDTLILIFYYQ